MEAAARREIACPWRDISPVTGHRGGRSAECGAFDVDANAHARIVITHIGTDLATLGIHDTGIGPSPISAHHLHALAKDLGGILTHHLHLGHTVLDPHAGARRCCDSRGRRRRCLEAGPRRARARDDPPALRESSSSRHTRPPGQGEAKSRRRAGQDRRLPRPRHIAGDGGDANAIHSNARTGLGSGLGDREGAGTHPALLAADIDGEGTARGEDAVDFGPAVARGRGPAAAIATGRALAEVHDTQFHRGFVTQAGDVDEWIVAVHRTAPREHRHRGQSRGPLGRTLSAHGLDRAQGLQPSGGARRHGISRGRRRGRAAGEQAGHEGSRRGPNDRCASKKTLSHGRKARGRLAPEATAAALRNPYAKLASINCSALSGKTLQN